MPQVDFYILDQADRRSKLQFACRLVQKIRGLDLKVMVQTSDSNQSAEVDRLLWTFRQNSFIPHGIIRKGALTWADYPVQISHAHHDPDHADVLVNLREQVSEEHFKYDRVVELVGGDEADRASARNRYRSYRDQGVEPKTHRMGQD
ncbi:MAG: DNA polymerase III subunit chi [Gammaproteobacteria bacterium]|nr:DNA polymerase III subunit chi [Gammaproteobacteria bacterium]MYD76471.1 DNA polymerase III subunit chi [Gammaproteobacteria bacterium]MYJ52855.1 DNA polymerase III subunit chi [Gammaproteobacteria bacterium]